MLLFREQFPGQFGKILSTILTLPEEQNSEKSQIKFSSNGLQICPFNQYISTICKINKQLFSSYFCEKDLSLKISTGKLRKILDLFNQSGESLTATYELPNSEINFRIFNSNNNQKVLVNLSCSTEIDQMVDQIKESQQKTGSNIRHFFINSTQLLRICSEFAAVSQKVQIKYDPEPDDIKKYIIFEALTINGIKTVSLSEQKTSQQILANLQLLNNNQTVTISSLFSTQLLLKIATLAVDSIFTENIKIYMPELPRDNIFVQSQMLRLQCQLQNGKGEVVWKIANSYL